MKKIVFVISILLILLITPGCLNNNQNAAFVLKENLEKDCDNYTSIDYNTFGGGEFQDHGRAEVGICDGKIITAYAVSVESSLFCNEYEYKKMEFEFPLSTKFDFIFGDNLFFVSDKYDESVKKNSISLDLVVNENDLATIVTKIEEEFLPFIEKEDLGSIGIYIYTTTYSNVRDDDVILGYSVFNNPYLYEIRSKYNYMNTAGTIIARIDNKEETTKDLIDDFNGSLFKFKMRNHLL